MCTLVTRRGVLSTMANVARYEGHRALYCGLVPGLQRQMVMSGLRLGLYERVREGYRDLLGVEAGLGWGMLAARVMAGLTTGSLAICVAQPMDVVKIRMQVNIMMTHGNMLSLIWNLGCGSRVQIQRSH